MGCENYANLKETHLTNWPTELQEEVKEFAEFLLEKKVKKPKGKPKFGWAGALKNLQIIPEVKGFEREQDRQKEGVVKRWIRTVNHHGEFGRWAFLICRDPRRWRENMK